MFQCGSRLVSLHLLKNDVRKYWLHYHKYIYNHPLRISAISCT